MANGILAKFVSNISYKNPRVSLSRGVLQGISKSKMQIFSVRACSKSVATCSYSEQELKSNRTNKDKNPNVNERIFRFLKVNPEKVIQKLKKELNTLKIGTGLYDMRPYKCTIKTASPFIRYTAPASNVKVSAKGTRHQFNFPEKVPHILSLIKQDLLTIKASGRGTRNKAGCDL